MNFKSQLDRDIKNVFHDTSTFADKVKFYYDDKPYNIPVVLDYAEFTDRKKTVSDHAEGLFSVDLIMFVSFEDLKKVPRRGQEIEMGEEIYKIEKVKNEAGELTLYLGLIME